ncbi:hypothetical protein ACQPXH_20490 [Nocardia sp. CA-135953]|uniref:hypothetical protein n=1 Tax=Nocardia sp. CA-135953 TaxID=3239978 RepID=UPI003D951BD3
MNVSWLWCFAVDDLMRALALTIVTRGLCSTEPTRDATTLIERDLPLVARGLAWRVLLSGKGFEWILQVTGRRFEAANSRLLDTVAQLVTQYRADDHTRGDLLALSIAARDPDTGNGLTDDQICDEMVNLLLAGTETTRQRDGLAVAGRGGTPHSDTGCTPRH